MRTQPQAFESLLNHHDSNSSSQLFVFELICFELRVCVVFEALSILSLYTKFKSFVSLFATSILIEPYYWYHKQRNYSVLLTIWTSGHFLLAVYFCIWKKFKFVTSRERWRIKVLVLALELSLVTKRYFFDFNRWTLQTETVYFFHSSVAKFDEWYSIVASSILVFSHESMHSRFWRSQQKSM